MEACVDGQNVEFLLATTAASTAAIYVSTGCSVAADPQKTKNKAKRECTVNILYSRIAMIRNTKQTHTHT